MKGKMEPYKHIVQYYETDRMGITHHSNYIRWMEEARIDFLRQISWDYNKLEKKGIISPVISVECKYRKPTTFPDEIFIQVSIIEYNGVVLKLKYLMSRQDGVTVCEGFSEHCFLTKEGKMMRLKTEYPEFYELLISLIQEAD